MARNELVVKGYRDFLRACARADKETKKAVRTEIRRAGEVVRREATDRFNPYSSKSAAGYRVRVRQTGVIVEQSLRKTTGTNPRWGALQMTQALIPARAAKEHLLIEEMDRAIDRIADHFERN